MASIELLINTMGGGDRGYVGGAERVMSEIYNSFPYDMDVELVTLKDGESEYTLYGQRKSIYLPRSSISQRFTKSKIKCAFDIIDYIRHLKKSGASVSLSFEGWAHYVNLIACHICGIKSIISIRNNPYPPYGSWLSKVFAICQLFLIKVMASSIIVNSNDIKRTLCLKYNINKDVITVIYNPKDITMIQKEMLDPITECTSYGLPIPKILVIGRFEYQKSQWHAIRAFAEIRKRRECKLIICGAGKLREKLEELVHDLDISNDVVFLGWCHNTYKFMHNSTVLVLSSLFEGQPNVLIEAMICGCPVVASDCPYGPAEILDGGKYGVLTQQLTYMPDDAITPLSTGELDLAKGIELVLSSEDYRKQLITAAYERINIFSKDELCKQYYDTILATLSKS